jgi:hypothetical protein
MRYGMRFAASRPTPWRSNESNGIVVEAAGIEPGAGVARRQTNQVVTSPRRGADGARIRSHRGSQEAEAVDHLKYPSEADECDRVDDERASEPNHRQHSNGQGRPLRVASARRRPRGSHLRSIRLRRDNARPTGISDSGHLVGYGIAPLFLSTSKRTLPSGSASNISSPSSM